MGTKEAADKEAGVGHEKWCLADKKDVNFNSEKWEVTESS